VEHDPGEALSGAIFIDQERGKESVEAIGLGGWPVAVDRYYVANAPIP
jgi:hypothetical protein